MRYVIINSDMRFLNDHLLGDIYFKTSRLKHNLDRVRNRFKPVLDIEAHLCQMHEIVNKYPKLS